MNFLTMRLITIFILSSLVVFSGRPLKAQIGGIPFWQNVAYGGCSVSAPSLPIGIVTPVMLYGIDSEKVYMLARIKNHSSGVETLAEIISDRTLLSGGVVPFGSVNVSVYSKYLSMIPPIRVDSAYHSRGRVPIVGDNNTVYTGQFLHELYGYSAPDIAVNTFLSAAYFSAASPCTPINLTRVNLGTVPPASLTGNIMNARVIHLNVGGDKILFEVKYTDRNPSTGYATRLSVSYLKLVGSQVPLYNFRSASNWVSPGGDYVLSTGTSIYSDDNILAANSSYLYVTAVGNASGGSSRRRLGVFRMPLNKSQLDAGTAALESVLDWEYHDVSGGVDNLLLAADDSRAYLFTRISAGLYLSRFDNATKAMVRTNVSSFFGGAEILSFQFDPTSSYAYGTTSHPSSESTPYRFFRYDRATNTFTWIT